MFPHAESLAVIPVPLLDLSHRHAKFFADFYFCSIVPMRVSFEVALEHLNLNGVLLLLVTIASFQVLKVLLLDSESSHLKVDDILGADSLLRDFRRSCLGSSAHSDGRFESLDLKSDGVDAMHGENLPLGACVRLFWSFLLTFLLSDWLWFMRSEHVCMFFGPPPRELFLA